VYISIINIDIFDFQQRHTRYSFIGAF